MKLFLEKVVPHTSVISMIIIILLAVSGIISGSANRELYIDLLCMIADIAILSWVDYAVLGQIEFKKSLHYLLASFLLWYIGIGIFLFGRNWWGFHVSNLIEYTAITVLVYAVITRWNMKKLQKDAEEINELLKSEMRCDIM